MTRLREFLDYLDGPLGGSFTLAPDEALSYFASKGLRTTFDWREMLGEEHASSFTIAKMMDTDLLADVQASLTDAMARGVPFREWADSIVPTLQAKGWWGRKAVMGPDGNLVVAQLGSPSRLATIFRTNMQGSYAAGAWAQIREQADVAPYLMYDAVDDHRTREEHAALDGKVAQVDSQFWQVHYPPNGWNCRCGVIQLSADDMADLGIPFDPPGPQPTYTTTNPLTGKSQKLPKGVDPGFNVNQGEERLKALAQAAIGKARKLPPAQSAAAIKGLTAAEQAAQDTLAADVAAAQKALAKEMGQQALKRATLKAAERSAQYQLDAALASKTPYLAKAITDLKKTKAGQAMAPGDLLAAAQAQAAKLKAQTHLSEWKKAYLADKKPPGTGQAAFDALPADAQEALVQQLDALKAAAAAEKAAQAQLAKLAAGDLGKLEAQLLVKMGPQLEGLGAAEVVAKVQAAAAAQKLAISQATTLAGLKKALVAGKAPSPAQYQLLASLDDEAKAKLLADVEVAKAKAAPPPPAPEAPTDKAPQVLGEPAVDLDPSRLVQIGPQRGSNPGGLYQDSDTGVKWYVKRPGNPEQARNEVLAAELYRAAGMDVPELRLITMDGQPAIASRIVDGLEVGKPAQLAAAPGAADGFAVDAWLANWDVVGQGYDNLLLRGGRAFRVDTGGALRFRAQGGLKGQAFGDDVLELDTLRQAGVNPQAAAVFGKATPAQLEDGARRVLSIPEARIRQLVDEFGPLDRGERDKLLATLLARRESLAQRFPAARPRTDAPEPVAVSRVTEYEQREIEASRANGYTLTTDGGDIEDHHVVAMTYTRPDGKPGTRLALKLRPEAAARLQATLPSASAPTAPVLADLSSVKAKGLELLKGINSQAKTGGVLRPDKEPVRLQQFKAELAKVAMALEGKAGLVADPLALAKHLAALRQLDHDLDAYFARVGVGGKAEAFPAFDFGALSERIMGQLPKPATPTTATAWRKLRGLSYRRAVIKAGKVTETLAELDLPYVGTSYQAEFDGGRVTFVPDVGDNALAARGYAQLDVEGTGAEATARALAELERLGVSTTRTTAGQRTELYLDRHLYLRGAKDRDLERKWEAASKLGDEQARIDAKLALLNQAAGFDVRTSPHWDPEGKRQAFGHGRVVQLRADLKPDELAKFNAEHVLFHNPAGLGWDGGSSVLERFQLLVEAGGQLASQMDRIRRGVALSGSSVSADFQSGGANYIFTRLSSKGGSIRSHGSGFILKPELTQRLDAFSYSGDRYGTVDREVQRRDRAADLAGLRANARGSGNETNFRDSISLFDAIQHVVLDNVAQVTQARAFMRANGYATWPDGRSLEDVIIAKNFSPYRK